MRVAVMQTSPGSDVEQNLVRLIDALGIAARQAADVLVTPEMFLSGYDIGRAAARAAAQPIDGPLVDRLCRAAEAAGVAVVVGLPELEGDSVFNSGVLISSEGDVLTSYRKSHLYGDLDRSQFAPGDRLGAVIELAGVNVALAICFDIEFPEVARSLSLRGAEVILVPTANWLPTVNTRVVPTRGEENGTYIVYANYCGAEGERAYCGLSCIVDPWGNDVVRLAAGHGPRIAVGEISTDAVAKARAGCDYLASLRPSLYHEDIGHAS